MGFCDPISRFDELFDFSSLVTVLLRFVRPVIDLAEGVFGVANNIGDNFQGFRHRLIDPLCDREGVNDANSGSRSGTGFVNAINIGHSKFIQNNTTRLIAQVFNFIFDFFCRPVRKKPSVPGFYQNAHPLKTNAPDRHSFSARLTASFKPLCSYAC